MKRKEAMATLVVALAIVGLCFFLLQQNQKTRSYPEKKAESKRTYIDAKKDSPRIHVFDDYKFVFVAQSGKSGSLEYGQDFITEIVGHQLEYKDLSWYEKAEEAPLIRDEEYFKVIAYSLNNSDYKAKEFDILKMLGENNRYRGDYNQKLYYKDNQDYLQFDIKMSNFGTSKELMLDLSTGQFVDIKQFGDLKQVPSPYGNRDIAFGGVYKDLRQKLAENYRLYLVSGYIEKDLSEKNMDKEVDVSNTNFSELYPEIAKDMKNLSRLYFRPKQYSSKEWFDKLLYWFAPKGQDALEVYATDPVTGEKTQIKSYDELQAWAAEHPE